MSAIFGNTTSQFLDASGLSGLSTNGRIMLCGWGLWDNTTLASAQRAVEILETSGDETPSLGSNVNSSAQFTGTCNSTTFGASSTITANAWFSFAAAYGPWDNASRNRRRWLNGSVAASSTALNFPGLSLSYVIIGKRGNNSSPWKGRIAQVGLFAPASEAEEDTIATQQQLYHVDLISIPPAYSWRLSGDVSAATGGVALTNNGTVTFDGADDPPVGSPSGGGGNVISSACFMHRETPQQHARRLGFTGWRGALV